MLDLCNTRKDHLYIRYFCKKCNEFHKSVDSLYFEHKEFKVNRYFCPLCYHTHISSRGDIFLKHFKDKGKEISYYGECCALKCDIKKYNNKTITDDQTKKLLDIFHEIEGITNELWHTERDFTLNDNEFERIKNIKTLKNRMNEKEYHLSLYKTEIGIF